MLRSHKGAQLATASITTVKNITAEIPFDGHTTLTLVVENTGSNALTNVILQIQVLEGGDWFDLIDGTTWNTVAGPLKYVRGTLNTLASSATAIVMLDLYPCHRMRFRATANSAADVTTHWRVRD